MFWEGRASCVCCVVRGATRGCLRRLGQDIPTFAQSEVGRTLDPGHDLGCSELLSATLPRMVCMVLSRPFVLKCRSDPPPPLVSCLTRESRHNVSLASGETLLPDSSDY